jgi:hypothetical protein
MQVVRVTVSHNQQIAPKSEQAKIRMRASEEATVYKVL